MTSQKPHVVVIGAGITGASIAYHLSKQKARVTLIDKETNAGNNATEKSFGWINCGFDVSDTYLHFRQQAIIEWQRLEEEFKGLFNLQWTGALTWHQSIHNTEQFVQRLTSFGYPGQLIEPREIKQLEPNLREIPTLAMFAKHEGAINPGFTAHALIDAARDAGADIQTGNEVISFITNGSQIEGIITANGKVIADMVVITSGANTISLCKTLGLTLPVKASPAILLHLDNSSQFVNHIVSTPFFEIRPELNTLTFAAEEYIDGSLENNPQIIAQRTLERVKTSWQNTDYLKLSKVLIGQRPIPEDNLPIIGRTNDYNNLYLAVMHAGVTLAAIVGKLSSKEILSNDHCDSLLPYRLNRFFR